MRSEGDSLDNSQKNQLAIGQFGERLMNSPKCLAENSDYIIKNWNKYESWGQLTFGLDNFC